MKNVGVFVDVSNLYYSIRKKFEGRKLDYKKYLERALGPDRLYRAFAYGVYVNDSVIPFIDLLKVIGFEPRFFPPHETKAHLSLNIAMAMDIVRTIGKLDTVIIGSSDNNLDELVRWVKEQGVKCEIYSACIPRSIREVADRWIDIKEGEIEHGTTHQTVHG